MKLTMTDRWSFIFLETVQVEKVIMGEIKNKKTGIIATEGLAMKPRMPGSG